MAISQGKSTRSPSGARNVANRGKRKSELGRDPAEDTYVKIGEFDLDTVREILLQNEFYGQIYETIFLNKYKENVKGAN